MVKPAIEAGAVLSVSKASRGGAVPSMNLAMPPAEGATLRGAHFAHKPGDSLPHLAANVPSSPICAAPASEHQRPASRLKSSVQSLIEQAVLWRGSAGAPCPAVDSCDLVCLYESRPCARLCAGCAAERPAAAPGQLAPHGAAARPDAPPSNTGVNKARSGHGD